MGIETYSLGDLEKFNNIDPALPAFEPGNPALLHSKPPCHVGLPQPLRHALVLNERDELSMFFCAYSPHPQTYSPIRALI